MDIIGYEGLYKIYEDGRVWSIKTNKFLKPSQRNSYMLYRNFKYKRHSIKILLNTHYSKQFNINKKKIIGFENYYLFEDGRIWSIKNQKYKKLYLGEDDYYRVCLPNKTYLLHRLIAIHFIPNPENKTEVDHIDRNRKNNLIENLRWVTRSENNINKKVRNNKLPRHISLRKDNRWAINITRDKKYILRKMYSCNKYSLEDVVKIRNDYYIEFDIDIDD